ncbi:adhesion G-protein coupled receptor D1, partial [Biomphalaria glabrata]
KMCLVTAITLHYFLTSMFNWMLVEGIHLYVQLIYVFSTSSHIVKYSLFAWVTPVLIVSVAAVVFQEDYRSDKLCWISIKVLRYFLVPTLSVTVIINVIILSHVILIIKKSQSSLNLLSQSEKKLFWTGLKASVSLLPLLGLTWTFAFFIVSAEISTVMVHLFTYLFTIANSFQGLLVFIFHCLLSTEVHIAVRNYYRINFGSQYWERSKSRSEYRSSEYRKSEFDSKEDRVESVILPEPVVSEEVVPQPAASLQRSRQMSEVTDLSYCGLNFDISLVSKTSPICTEQLVKRFFPRTLVERMCDVLRTLVERMCDVLRTLVERMCDVLRTLVERMCDVLRTLVERMCDVLRTLVERMCDVLRTLVERMCDVLRTLVERMCDVLRTLVERMCDVLRTLVERMCDVLRWKKVKSLSALKCWQYVFPPFQLVLNFISKLRNHD